MTTLRVWAWLMLAAGLSGAVLLVLDSGPVSALPLFVQALVYLGVAAVGAAMSVAGAVFAAPARRRIWVAVAAGQCLYLCGDVLWVVFEYVLHIAPYPSLADASYLGKYAACCVGLAWLVRGRREGRDRAAFLDAAIISTGFAVLAALFVVIPAAQAGGETLLSQLVAGAYPVGDVLLLAMLIRLFATRATWSVALAALTAASVLLLATDVHYTLLVVGGRELPHWHDLAYLLSYLLLGFCALHPSSRVMSEPVPDRDTAVTLWRVAALGMSSAMCPVLLLVSVATGAALNDYVLGIGAILGSVLVLMRLHNLLRRAEQQAVQLSALARTDGLTGIANRRTWDHELSRACQQARETGTPLTVALMDLDHFKSYNDTHGHQMGDLVLKETAAAWTQVLDGRGVLARYGGEEFTVLVPGPTSAAMELLERMRGAVSGGQTCSIGFSAWAPEEEPHRAVARADEALYRAKRQGRNRIASHDGRDIRQLPDQPPQPLDLRPVP